MALQPAERIGKRFVNPVPTNVGGISIAFKVGPRILFNSASRSPRKPLGPFKTDARIYQTLPETGLRVTWFGHSSMLVEMDGMRVLIDPVWDKRAAPTTWAGPKRFFPPTLRLEDLPPLNAIIISHDHYDHLGAGTVRQLAQMQSQKVARWITPLGVGNLLQNLGVNPAQITELNWTGEARVGDVTICALPARHFSGRSLFNRFETLWASFALIGPEHRVCYGADSGEWFGFGEIGTAYGPFDLTMLEVGAFNALWADIHMGPEGAVRSFRAMGGQGLLMPIHWGLFDLALHPWQEPIKKITAVEGLPLWSPSPGVPTNVVRGEEHRSDWWR